MKEDISWASSKDDPADKVMKPEKRDAGKGDKPRYDLSKFEKGYGEIKWKSKS